MSSIKLKKIEDSKIVKTSIGDVKVRAVTIIDIFEDDLILECFSSVLGMIENHEGKDVMSCIFKTIPLAARQVIFKCSNINDKYKDSLESEINIIENIDILTSILELTISDKKRALEVVERSGNVYASIRDMYNRNEHIFSDIKDKESIKVPEDINDILSKYKEV